MWRLLRNAASGFGTRVPIRAGNTNPCCTSNHCPPAGRYVDEIKGQDLADLFHMVRCMLAPAAAPPPPLLRSGRC